jgi:hypothetical protein
MRVSQAPPTLQGIPEEVSMKFWRGAAAALLALTLPAWAGAQSDSGRISGSVGTTLGIGTNRQVQLAFRFNF